MTLFVSSLPGLTSGAQKKAEANVEIKFARENFSFDNLVEWKHCGIDKNYGRSCFMPVTLFVIVDHGSMFDIAMTSLQQVDEDYF